MKAFFLHWLPGLLLWLVLSPAAAVAEQGLLWQISGKGAQGYLFGTMHSDDERVTQLPAEVARHFAIADTLVLEVALDERSQQAAAVQMLLPPGNSVSTLLGEPMATEVKEVMRARGVSAESTERMQLWVIAMTLSMPQPQSGLFLDKLLYQQAGKEGKGFEPLESINEQLSVFTALTVAEQKELLQSVLRHHGEYPLLFEEMTQAYLDRDLERLRRMSRNSPISDNTALQRKIEARLIDKRNQRMAARIETVLGKGRVFVAVGALHLPGEEGLIALLRQRGYTLEALY